MEVDELLNKLREFARTLKAEQFHESYDYGYHNKNEGAVELAIKETNANVGRLLLDILGDEDPQEVIGKLTCGHPRYSYLDDPQECTRIPNHKGLHRNKKGETWTYNPGYGCWNKLGDCVRSFEHVGDCMDKDGNIIPKTRAKKKVSKR